MNEDYNEYISLIEEKYKLKTYFKEEPNLKRDIYSSLPEIFTIETQIFNLLTELSNLASDLNLNHEYKRIEKIRNDFKRPFFKKINTILEAQRNYPDIYSKKETLYRIFIKDIDNPISNLIFQACYEYIMIKKMITTVVFSLLTYITAYFQMKTIRLS